MKRRIAEGNALDAAARVLEEAGAIDSASGFVRRAKLFGSDEPIKPGEYKIKKGMDEREILALLQRSIAGYLHRPLARPPLPGYA